MLLLGGCGPYIDKEYVSKESAENVNVELVKTETGVEYVQDDYIFRPNFSNFSPQAGPGNSFLIITSLSEKSIYLENVELISATGSITKVNFNKRFDFEEKNSQDTDKRKVLIPLFNKKNVDLQKYWDAGDIKVKLNYRGSDEQQKSIFFEYKLSRELKMAWPST